MKTIVTPLKVSVRYDDVEGERRRTGLDPSERWWMHSLSSHFRVRASVVPSNELHGWLERYRSELEPVRRDAADMERQLPRQTGWLDSRTVALIIELVAKTLHFVLFLYRICSTTDRFKTTKDPWRRSTVLSRTNAPGWNISEESRRFVGSWHKEHKLPFHHSSISVAQNHSLSKG